MRMRAAGPTSVLLCTFHEAAAGWNLLSLSACSKRQRIKTNVPVPNVKPQHARHDHDVKVHAHAAASSIDFVQDHVA